MSNVRRKAPAILKRRSTPQTPVAPGAAFPTSRAKLIKRSTALTTTKPGPAASSRNHAVPPNKTIVVGSGVDESSVDVWELRIETESSETPGRRSVSTQADFPSRAFAALNHQLAETCNKVCPTLGARASRGNVIEKLIEIVNDAEGSTKARFLLEQIFAYKTKMPHHSNFMTRQCKLLMDLSQKTYQHLKDVDGTGLLTLPTKGTLRSRYPETLPVTTKNEVEVLLQMEASAEGADGTADEQAATYYYVLPSEDILPNDMINQ